MKTTKFLEKINENKSFEKVVLYNGSDEHDKIYVLILNKDSIDAYYGRRDPNHKASDYSKDNDLYKALKFEPKGTYSNIFEAKEAMEKIIKSKFKKGYVRA